MSPIDLSRRQLLASSIAAGCVGPAFAAQTSGIRARRLIVVVVNGGWDPLFCFVPRLGDPAVNGPEVDQDPSQPLDVEQVRWFGDVPLVVNDFKRPFVSSFFARWMAEAAVVNGIWTGAIAHTPSMVRMLTGTPSEANPDFATIVGYTWGAALPLGAVDLAGGSYAGTLAASTGSVGHRAQILNLLDDPTPFVAPTWTGRTWPTFAPTPGDDAAVEAWLRARTDRFRVGVGDGARNDALLDARHEAMDRAARLRAEASGLLASLSLGVTPSALASFELAVDLLEQGICAAAFVDTRLDWDTHASHALQHGFYDATFLALDALMTALSSRGMLADTMVVVVSEMTKTPLLNAAAGKDHWPHATALLLGAGVRGGGVYGGYSELLESSPVDFGSGAPDSAGDRLQYDHFVAGVLAGCDVDPAAWLPGVTPFEAFLR